MVLDHLCHFPSGNISRSTWMTHSYLGLHCCCCSQSHYLEASQPALVEVCISA